MKFSILFLCMLFGVACTKPKEEYRQAIQDIQNQEAVEAEIEREEVPPEPLPVDERSRGSNDAEGMGMDE